MSALVCGKRSFIEDLHSTTPPLSKRIRCSSTSPVRRSRNSPSRDASRDVSSLVSHLRSLFSDMDQQYLQSTLEACDYDLASAIKCLNELQLQSSGKDPGLHESQTESREARDEEHAQLHQARSVSVEDCLGHTEGVGDPDLVANGCEWVDLFVREMQSSLNMDDARARASRALETLEKVIIDRLQPIAENLRKENLVLRQQVDNLIRDSSILKRAVAIQHERQKELEERENQLQQLKQLVPQYQEQLRTLEVNNYALTLHLRQAQQGNSIPGRFHPDVF
eukprot:TRINITY_DN4064_c0_g1_i1.p1 TRINITY_DN4064_c0_g1~~TRINITY_DN4064_c0_g1_i1.p1  ORF type:complete len:280 (-),score=55.16 TRINITY_DN4064_c0_g1_i1:262-1101(-)